jgi:serine phosphatase RsbU (regulator of sigma subunit)
MIQSIHVSASGGARTMIDRITDDVTSFIGPTPRNDDITLIAIRKK